MHVKTLMNSLTVGCLLGSVAGMTLTATAVQDEIAVKERGMGYTPHSGIDGPVPNPTPDVDGEQLTQAEKDPGFVEDMDQMMERLRLLPPPVEVKDNVWTNRRDGVWQVPSRNSTYYPRSGEHYIINKWGDTRMGITFNDVIDLDGVWIAGQAGEGVWAESIRVHGYRNGELIATTDWWEDIDDRMDWFAINFQGVDRVEFEALPSLVGGGWYALDDFTFTRDGEQTVLNFDDLNYRTNLSSTDYAGFDWELGNGTRDGADDLPEPQTPPGFDGDVDPDDRWDGDDEEGDGRDEFSGGDRGSLPGPNLNDTFETVKRGDAGQFSFPADTCGAIGPNHFVCVVNRNFAVYSKSTGNQILNTSLGSFQPGTSGDPRVLYDHHADRWVVISTNFGSRIYLAYSLTSDPTGAWFKTNFVAAAGADSGRWVDYPTLGLDGNGIYIAAYMVGGPGHTVFAIDKAPLLDSSPSLGNITAFRNLNWEGALQPASTYGDSGGCFVVSRTNSTQLRVRKVQGDLGSNPSLSTVAFVSIPGHSSPPDAPSLGSGTPLDTVGTRIMNAVWRDGHLVCAHTINQSGRAAIRWYDITTSNFVDQNGTIADSSLHYFFPGISINNAGDIVVGFSGSSSSQYVGCYYAGRKVGFPSGQMSDPVQYKAGTGPQNNIDGAGRNRWGDYSLTSVDPDDDNTFYTIQKFGRSSNIWGTFVAELEYEQFEPNNDCEDATFIFDGITAFSTELATTDGPDEPGCGLVAEDAGNDVWFKYQPTCIGTVTVGVCNSAFNNTLVIYEDSCPTGPGEAIACDENGCGTAQAEVTFLGDPETLYYIRVGGKNGQTGTGLIEVECFPTPPANDDCADALFAFDGANPYSTDNATTDGGLEVDCGFPDINGLTDDVWFRYTPSCTGQVTASVCDSDFNNSIVIYEGGCPSGNNEAIACDENGCGTAQASVTFQGDAGTEYWIRIAGKNDQEGTGVLDISCVPGVACDGDIDGSGDVGVNDLLDLLASWGPCGDCPADITGDGTVDVNDLLELLAAWGPCEG